MYFSNLFAAVGLSLFAAVTVSAGGGFSASCSNYYVSGYTLTATCGNGSGGTKTTSIDLNRCIANYNGNLACAANGGFGGSCSGCGIRTGSYMICGCKPSGTPIIDLNSCVANYGGNLACAT